MKFRNTSDRALVVVGYGIIQPGHIVELPDNFNNANFEKIEKEKTEKKEDK